MKREKEFFQLFALLSKASSRKKVYARKAAKEGRQDIALFLRAVSESEAIQARRLLNNIKGRIDRSEDYLAVIFEREIAGLVEEYNQAESQAEELGLASLKDVIKQLKRAEKLIASFYSGDKKDVTTGKSEKYSVCPFCGYLTGKKPPESCPICGADKKSFLLVQ